MTAEELFDDLHNKYGDGLNWRMLPLTNRAFVEQLDRELGGDYALSGKELYAVAKCDLNGNVLYVTDEDDKDAYYMVRLSYSDVSTDPPAIRRFGSIGEVGRFLEDEVSETKRNAGERPDAECRRLNRMLLDSFPELIYEFSVYVSWQDGMDTGAFLTYEDVFRPLLEKAVAANDAQFLRRAAGFIDRLYLMGGYAENVITVGVLEGLKANCDNGAVREFLTPLTRKAFDGLTF